MNRSVELPTVSSRAIDLSIAERYLAGRSITNYLDVAFYASY